MATGIVLPREIEEPVRRDLRDYVPLLLGVGLLVFVVLTAGSMARTRRTQAEGRRLDAVVLDWSHSRNERYGNDVTSTLLELRVRAPDGTTFDSSVRANGEITGLREGARTAVRADPRDPAYVELDGHPLEEPAATPWIGGAALFMIAVGAWNVRHPRHSWRREILVMALCLAPLGLAGVVSTLGVPERYPLPPPVTAAR